MRARPSAERHRRRVAQPLARLVDRRVVAQDLAGPRRLAADAGLDPRRLGQQLEQPVQARLDAACELEDLPAGAVSLGGAHEPVGQVLAEDEVARLLAVAVDDELLPGPQAADEERDHVALVRRAGAVRVREPDGDGVHAVGAVERRAVRLADRLARAVRRERRHRLVLAGRVGAVAERGVRRREDEPADVGPPGGLERHERAARVLVEVDERLLDRLHHARARRQVKGRVAPAGGAAIRASRSRTSPTHELGAGSLEVRRDRRPRGRRTRARRSRAPPGRAPAPSR